jgi:A/G-specific adenine glycosylase
MLVLLRGGKILLEKRPPSGIWGGLWCLPELPEGANPQSWSRERYGCEIDAPEALPDLAHGFTHFKLSITPLMCRVRDAQARSAEPGAAWFISRQAGLEAIPVPVRKILAQIAGEGSD